MEKTFTISHPQDALECGFSRSMLRLVFPVFTTAVVLSIIFDLLSVDKSAVNPLNAFHWIAAFFALTWMSCSAFVCYCLRKGLENSAHPMKTEFTVLMVFFLIAGVLAFYPNDFNSDFSVMDSLLGLFSLAFVIVGWITAHNLSKNFTGTLQRVGQVVVRYQIIPLLILVAVGLLSIIFGLSASADNYHHSSNATLKWILKIGAFVIIGAFASIRAKKRKEKNEADRAIEAALNGEDVAVSVHDENSAAALAIRYRTFDKAVLGIAALLSIIGFLFFIGGADWGIIILLVPLSICFVGSIIYAMRLVFQMLIAGTPEERIIMFPPKKSTSVHPLDHASSARSERPSQVGDFKPAFGPPPAAAPLTEPPISSRPSSLTPFYWVIGILSVLLIILLAILAKRAIDKSVERDVDMMVENAHQILGNYESSDPISSEDADRYGSPDDKVVDQSPSDYYNERKSTESTVSSEEREIINNGNFDQALVGSFTLDGYINGEYPVTMRISVSSTGKVTGKYAYRITLEKYGDKPSSWIKIQGRINGNSVKLSQDCPGISEKWPPIDATILTDSSTVHLNGGWHHNNYYSIDVES